MVTVYLFVREILLKFSLFNDSTKYLVSEIILKKKKNIEWIRVLVNIAKDFFLSLADILKVLFDSLSIIQK